MNNRIFLIFHGRFPGEKAASLFVAKNAEAFAKMGIKTMLIVPRRIWRNRIDPFNYYDLQKKFEIVYLPTLDFFTTPFLRAVAFPISFVVFSIFSFIFLLFKANKKDIIYSNESLVIFLSSFYFPRTLYELHDFPEQKIFFYKWLFKKSRYLLITNKWKAEKIESAFSVPKEKIILERNAVEVKEFNIAVTKEEARRKLDLSLKKKIIIYTGHLYSWKGVDTLAEAAKMLPEVLVVFVGGTAPDIARFKAIFGSVENILIVGHKDHAEIPYWQKAADVLVLPNTAKEDISKFYTSPMKLFEYMASKRPIVATDIPSIREIVNNDNSIIVSPDNVKDLVLGIERALNNKELVNEITTRAYQNVLNHSWEKRAKRIFDFMKKNSTFKNTIL